MLCILLITSLVVPSIHSFSLHNRRDLNVSVQHVSESTQIFICNDSTIDCNNNGICSRDNTSCICDNKYATYNSYTQCNYKKMNRALPFATHLIFGWFCGVGEFILGNYIRGSMQIAIFIIFLISMCYIAENMCVSNKKTNFMGWICTLSIIAVIIWYAITLNNIGTGIYKDINGIDTYW